jgi:membrane-associated phospholipid phosphatase
MSLFVERSIKVIQKSTIKNTNIIFFVCLTVVFLVNLILNSQESLHTWIEIIGSIVQIAIPMYVIVPVLWKKDSAGALQMLKLLAVILGITWAFKLGLGQVFGINEMRPRGGSMSFPSGHTAGAFTGAVFLSIRYGWKYALCTLPLAIFVGYTRIYSMAHWPSDVIASIALCVVAGIFLVRPLKKTVIK